MAQREPKNSRNKWLRIAVTFVGWFISFAIVLFVIGNSSAIWSKLQLWLHGKQPEQALPAEIAQTTRGDNRLLIPALDINVPIGYPEEYGDGALLDVLRGGVGHIAGTALPGTTGTSFIAGHSSQLAWEAGEYKSVFSTVDALDPGDDIVVYFRGVPYVYQVTEQRTVEATAVDILKETASTSRLALLTCWPIGTTAKRLVVFAELDATRSKKQETEHEQSQNQQSRLPEVR